MWSLLVFAGLLTGAWWLLVALRKREERQAREFERKLYELGRSHRGWE